MKSKKLWTYPLLLVLILCAAQLDATKLLHFNLQDLCYRSAQILRGTVVDVTQEYVAVGGGQLPVLHYKMRVTEAFKGQFPTEKGVPVAEFNMVGTLKNLKDGAPSIPGLPMLQKGGDYLLMIAPAGPVGITSTMGLRQGCFEVAGKAGQETVLNGYNNLGLFSGMQISTTQTRGPVAYSTVANWIHSHQGGQ